MNNSLRSWQVSVTLVLFALGLFLSVQFRTQQDLLASLASQKDEDLVAMWKNLDEKRNKLEEEIYVLNQEYRDLVDQADLGLINYNNLKNELDKLRLVNGLLPAQGPGVIITISGDTPILAVDLIDLINELWASGAEAIAVNDQRIVYTTGISQVEDQFSYYIAVKGQRLHYPITIKAIGDADTLEKGLTFTGGIIDILNSFSIKPEIEKSDQVFIPAVQNSQAFQAAKLKKN